MFSNKFAIWPFFILGLGLLGFWALWPSASFDDQDNFAQDTTKPWIEVTSNPVFLVNKSGETVRTLKTGDELLEGSAIVVGSGGRAVIYTGDGSELRLGEDTTFILEKSSFDKQDGKRTLSVSLIAGRVWSKVISLGNPASSWEVKTSKAVATVRGTAFGVDYRDGKSRFLGSENEVRIAVLDPLTGEAKKRTEITLRAGTEVEVSDLQADKLALEERAPTVMPAGKIVPIDDWVRENKSADEKINEEIKILVEQKKDLLEAQREYGEKKREEFKVKIEERREELKKSWFEKIINEVSKDEEKSIKLDRNVRERLEKHLKKIEEIKSLENDHLLDNVKKVEKTETTLDKKTKIVETTESSDNTNTINTNGANTTSETKPTRLVIESSLAIPEVVEGTKVFFKAILILNDGTKKDVTREATWSVDGNIGVFSSPGIFIPRFRDEDTELERVSGAINAKIKTPFGEFIAPSLKLDLIHKTDDTIPLG